MTRMPNQRADNQTLIAFALNRKLLQAIDQASEASGEDRSTLIRQALVNVIRESKGVVQEEWVHAQVRPRGAQRYEPVPAAPAAAAVATKLGQRAVAAVRKKWAKKAAVGAKKKS